MKQSLPIKNTIFIGYNPGFGSGYDKLLLSWSYDILMLTELGYRTFFTQASDFSDLKGEQLVLERLFRGYIQQILPAHENPFRAVTFLSATDAKERTPQSGWCCANHNMYGLMGWKDNNPEYQVGR